jgi:hypothetical protein
LRLTLWAQSVRLIATSSATQTTAQILLYNLDEVVRYPLGSSMLPTIFLGINHASQ